MRQVRDRIVFAWPTDWTGEAVSAATCCKHGWGDCPRCGTSEARDVIHRARTPDKRTARRLRKRARK